MTLRIAVTCRSGKIQKWQQYCIDRLVACASVMWVALIDAGESTSLVPHPPPLFDVPALRATPVGTPFGNVARCDASDDNAVRALDLDAILCFDETSPGALAGLARHGAWEFRFGSAAQNGAVGLHGRPMHATPCFWECYNEEPIAHLALVRRASDGANVTLRSAAVAVDVTSLHASVDRALYNAALLPAAVCNAIAAGLPAGGTTSGDTTDRGMNVPASAGGANGAAATREIDTFAALSLSFVLTLRRLGRIGEMLFVDKWNVGIAHCPIDRFLDGGQWPPVDWLPEAAGLDYRADPFGAAHDGRGWALVERFDARAARGRIEVFEIASNAWLPAYAHAMTSPAHMSYPFLVEDGGRLYCIPETLGQGSVSLYRAVDMPGRWEKVATLLDGFEAVDATVVRHGDRWWLFCTDFREPRHHRLYAFYADALAGPYRAHELNPVKIDPRSAGCAGTPFFVNGTLYRPAQDCSRSYGGSVVLNRVVDLSPTSFREETAAVVAPNRAYPSGVHTLSSFGAVTLVDGKRRAFTLRRVMWRLSWPLRRLLGGDS